MKFTGIKNLLFDLDGTLIDSSRGVIKATNAALHTLGEPPRADAEIKKFIGYPLETMFRSFSNKSYTDFWDSFQDVALIEIAESSTPINGADHTLRTLYARGYRIGIGTTKMRVHVDKILRKLDWNDIVIKYVGADDVTDVKPAPEAYIKLRDLLGGSLSDSLVIGDTINDILAARAAGLPVAAVNSPFGHDNELANSRPDLHINYIAELLNYLE